LRLGAHVTTAGSSLSVQFERSEVALAHVNRAAARFEAETTQSRRRRFALASRVLATSRPPSYHDSWNVSRVEDALVRLIAIAEEFTHGLLIEVTNLHLPSDPRVAALWDKHVDRETDTWEQRMATWRLMHGLAIQTSPRYDALLAFIEARNAVVHGLGSLTRKQLRTRNRSVDRLRAARIAVSGDRLILGEEDVAACADSVRTLVRWLDDAAAALA
jgi:hypothetical protein